MTPKSNENVSKIDTLINLFVDDLDMTFGSFCAFCKNRPILADLSRQSKKM